MQNVTPIADNSGIISPEDTHVAVLGLGKLGAPLLAVLSKHFKVTGVDSNAQTRDALMSGQSVYYEMDVNETLAQYRSNYHITADIEDALHSATVIFIVVPTPSRDTGEFDCSQIAGICEQLGHSAALKPKHLIAIVSTVMPGQMEKEIILALQRGGKKIGRDFSLCYNPSFIALGSVVNNIISPEFILIGEAEASAGDRLEHIHRTLCSNNPKIIRMNFINAEMAKLALNTFITTKITYANMIARLCEKLPNADSSAVLNAIGLDARVGSAYLKGAIGYGGPCFPRDNLALAALARQAGADVALISNVHEFNERQPDYLYSLIARYVAPGQSVGMLGITYKPNTHSIEKSQAWQVLQLVAQHFPETGFYDPQAIIDQEIAPVKRFATAKACIEHSDVIIIGTPWEEFHTMHILLNKSSVKCVIDFWGIIPMNDLNPDIHLVCLGKGGV